jgi:2-methylaconitate cis-trans-isomerase PrpF
MMYYRGGTSRAPIFRQEDLPASREDWAPILRAVIGSPDPNGRQLDGLGGGYSSLSKICVVGPPTRKGADVDFTFVQMGIKDDEVDYSGNCGNMLAAIGPFAVDSGMVQAPSADGPVSVFVHNTNTNKLIESKFEVKDGEAASEGDYAIDGVAGTGAKVELGFLDPAGSKTVGLLPTGNIIDEFDGIRATCIDAGNPFVFVTAESMGVDGTILPSEIDTHPDLLIRLDSIRRQASVAMGVSKDLASTPGAIPKVAMVSPPTTHTVLSGDVIEESEVDVVVRALSGGNPHRAVPLTMALSLGAASRIDGSIVQQMLRGNGRVDPSGLTVGHASGKITVAATYGEKGELEKATVFRTARRIMEGCVFVRRTASGGVSAGIP